VIIAPEWYSDGNGGSRMCTHILMLARSKAKVDLKGIRKRIASVDVPYEVAEKFARADLYVVNGAIKRWYVREWTTVAGRGAATPIRPNTMAVGKKSQNES